MLSLRKTQFAAPALALALTAATPLSLAEGSTFTWKTSMTVEGKAMGSTSRVQLIPGKLRVDITEGSQPGMSRGAYMILDAEANTMAMVSPSEKSVMMMEAGAMGQMAGAVGKMVTMDISNLKVESQDLGAGEKMLGRATHKYRITRSYTMTMSVLGRKMKSEHRDVTQSWLAQDLPADRSWEVWTEKFGRSASQIGGDAFKTLIEAEKQLPRGVPMKQIVENTDTDEKGGVRSSTMTTEMTELSRGNIPASAFEIPADYKVTDMKKVMADADQDMQKAKADCEKEHGKGSKQCSMSLDSDSLAAAAKEAAKNDAKKGAADAVKKGILGKLKKP